MSEDNTTGATPETQAPVTEPTLTDFEDTFFNRKPAPQEDPPAKAPTESETETLETENGTETEAENPDQVEAEAPTEPKKKKSAQERINELTAKARNAEREAEDLRRRIQAMETAPKVETTPDTTTSPTGNAPSPDALNEDGSPKYEFGQFDPAFLKDWTEYTFKEQELLAEKRRLAAAEDAIRQAEQEKLEAEKAELQTHWANKVEEFSAENTDFQQKSAELVNSLSYVEPEFGEQLALAMLTLDNGPQVLYHLATHPDEAHNLVRGGLAKVLMGLGALDGKFSTRTETPAAPKASKAPVPPPVNRGSNGQFTSDPNSLEAFEKKFFAR